MNKKTLTIILAIVIITINGVLFLKSDVVNGSKLEIVAITAVLGLMVSNVTDKEDKVTKLIEMIFIIITVLAEMAVIYRYLF